MNLTAERAFAIIVVLLAVAGSSLLFYLSTRVSAPYLPLDGLGGHTGEEVEVKGVVVGEESGVLYIYGDDVVARIFTEELTDVKIFQVVLLRAQVISCGKMPSLQMVSSRSLSIEGEIKTENSSWPSTTSEGIVHVTAVAIQVSNSAYRTTGYLIPLQTNSSFFLQERLPFVLNYPSQKLMEGSIVDVIGILSSGKLTSYTNNAFRILGRISSEGIYLGDLSEKISAGETDLLTTPFSLEGYILYEPTLNSSVYLTESLPRGVITLKCEIKENFHGHKGDLIRIKNSTLYFDTSSFKLCLYGQRAEVVKKFGVWNLTVEELAKNARDFLFSEVKVNGSIVRGEEEVLLKDDSGGRIAVIDLPGDVNGNVVLTGRVVYLDDCGRYALQVGG